MSRFYFNIGSEPDTVGVDLPDRKAVRSEAIRAAGEILRDIDGALSGREWTMTVRDERGDCVLKIEFFVTEEARP